MRTLLICTLAVFLANAVAAQVTICSWNLKDFGQSKSDATIAFIAKTLATYDIVGIQEVVAGHGGAQAVARLAARLNLMGDKWDYRVSEPTSGVNSYKRERYAYLWKTKKATMVARPWLENGYTDEINREPFLAVFKIGDKTFTAVNFHAVTRSKSPELEIKYFRFLPFEYTGQNLLFFGDFNCPQSHVVFNPLKRLGYRPVLIKQKTSLKQQCINDNCLSSAYDNMFYHHIKIRFLKSGVVPFYKKFKTLAAARTVSDHLPTWFRFSIN